MTSSPDEMATPPPRRSLRISSLPQKHRVEENSDLEDEPVEYPRHCPARPAHTWRCQYTDIITDKLSYDMMYEIVRHLKPADMLSLSRTCKSLRNSLMRKAAEPCTSFAFPETSKRYCNRHKVWKACVEADEIGFPPLPCDMSLPEMVALMFEEKYCSLCNQQDSGCLLFWPFRLRMCWSCEKEHVITAGEAADFLEEDVDTDCLEYCRVTQHRLRRRSSYQYLQGDCYLRSELVEWQERAIRVEPGLSARRRYVRHIAADTNDAREDYNKREEVLKQKKASEQKALQQARKDSFVDKITTRLTAEGMPADNAAFLPLYRISEKFKKGDTYPELNGTGKIVVPFRHGIDLMLDQVWRKVSEAVQCYEEAQQESQLRGQLITVFEQQTDRQTARRKEVIGEIRAWRQAQEDTCEMPIPLTSNLLQIGSFSKFIYDDSEKRSDVDPYALKGAFDDAFVESVKSFVCYTRDVLMAPPLGSYDGDTNDMSTVIEYLKRPTTVWKCRHKKCSALLGWPEVIRHAHDDAFRGDGLSARHGFRRYFRDDAERGFDIFDIGGAQQEVYAIRRILKLMGTNVVQTFCDLQQQTFHVGDGVDGQWGFTKLVKHFVAEGVAENDLGSIRYWTAADTEQWEDDCKLAKATRAVWICEGCFQARTPMTRKEAEEHFLSKHGAIFLRMDDRGYERLFNFRTPELHHAISKIRGDRLQQLQDEDEGDDQDGATVVNRTVTMKSENYGRRHGESDHWFLGWTGISDD